jgi:hypothetical protein
MKTIATYAFLPWLRQGVANTIASADHDPTVKTRASIDVNLTLAGDPVAGGAELTSTISNKVALHGPGDIVGIEQRAIVRTEPRNWITNFEANYIPAIDFYDEDFPWRYTPAAPDGAGLRRRRTSSRTPRTSRIARCPISKCLMRTSFRPPMNYGHGRMSISTRACRRIRTRWSRPT